MHGETRINTTYEMEALPRIDPKTNKYPACIVWTPIPVLTWIFPFIGHMGICTSTGIIRDFAGPYVVSTDNMAFGTPTRYLQLETKKVAGGTNVWDAKVSEASDIYKGKMHNLLCDNCHSHVAMALNLMNYEDNEWNMVKLAAKMFVFGRYVGICGFIKTWLPFLILAIALLIFFSLAY